MPAVASTTTGGTVQFSAIVTDSYGNAIANPQVQWHTTAGTIDASGHFVAGPAAGSGQVTAVVPGMFGTVEGTEGMMFIEKALQAEGATLSAAALEVRPTTKDGRTLVPIRALVEALGASAEWNAQTRTITIRRGELTILLTLGSATVYINGISSQRIRSIPLRTIVPS